MVRDAYREEHPVSGTVSVTLDLDLPADLTRLELPRGVDRRLQALLERQDRGELLSLDELAEAEGLVDLADLLTLLRLRAEPVVLRRQT